MRLHEEAKGGNKKAGYVKKQNGQKGPTENSCVADIFSFTMQLK